MRHRDFNLIWRYRCDRGRVSLLAGSERFKRPHYRHSTHNMALMCEGWTPKINTGPYGRSISISRYLQLERSSFF